METPTGRMAALDLELPAAPPTAGSYVNAVRSGSLLFLAGHVPIRADGSVVLGTLGRDLDTAAGYDAARAAALGALATMAQALGSVSQQQLQAAGLQRELALDNPAVSLEQTMVSMQKAQVGFQAVLSVRSRLVQAYSEIMNMQV